MPIATKGNLGAMAKWVHVEAELISHRITLHRKAINQNDEGHLAATFNILKATKE